MEKNYKYLVMGACAQVTGEVVPAARSRSSEPTAQRPVGVAKRRTYQQSRALNRVVTATRNRFRGHGFNYHTSYIHYSKTQTERKKSRTCGSTHSGILPTAPPGFTRVLWPPISYYYIRDYKIYTVR